MDAVVKSLLERPQPKTGTILPVPPTREEAEAAVRVLLRWSGDDPTREGLRDTPKRVVKAFEEFFSGYKADAADVLSRVFEEVHGYDDLVLVRDIPFSSHCEHHMVPFFGMAHIGYYPSDSGVVGLSKLARLVDIYAKRLQTQEALTAQIIGRSIVISARAAVPSCLRRSICACLCVAFARTAPKPSPRNLPASFATFPPSKSVS